MKNKFVNVWNNTHIKHFHGKIIYDDWLMREPFNEIIENTTNEILDLGCGQGNNTLYLLEKDKKVLSCDLSDEALKIVADYIPHSKTMQLDMSEKLPFSDNYISLVIADLSLQYFDKVTTKNIINELKRIIVNKGYLIIRLSSINDNNYGALQGEKIEEHFYFVEKRNKRYFDEHDIRAFFDDWNIRFLKETKSKLERYEYERDYFVALIKNDKDTKL